jgi:hypothetical protein
MKRKMFCLLIVLTLLSTLFDCAGLPNVQMRWMSTDNAKDYSPSNLASFVGRQYWPHVYSLDTIIDCRPQTDTIGWTQNAPRTKENQFDIPSSNVGGVDTWSNRPVTPITTQTNIPSFIMANFPRVFALLGLPTSKSKYDYKISGRLLRFEAVEESTYKGTVMIDFSIIDKKNDTLSRCSAVGTSNRWGRSYSSKNVMECLSNAVNACFSDLLSKCSILQK